MKWLTSEYDRLYNQVKEGRRVVCYVDYNSVNEGLSFPHAARDICTINNVTMALQARGIRYAHVDDYAGLDEEVRFERMCEKKKVRWLDESEEEEENDLKRGGWLDYGQL